MGALRNKRESLGLTLKEVADKIGVYPATVSSWELGKKTPRSKHKIKLAEILECPIEELFESSEENKSSLFYSIEETKENVDFPPSPFAKHLGELTLGGDSIVDCYVLDTGDRVISLNATVNAIADRSGGNLGEYIGVQALNPYINKELVLGETIEYNIPGAGFRGKGIKAETFLDICNAYVKALQDNNLKTERQKEIVKRLAETVEEEKKSNQDAL